LAADQAHLGIFLAPFDRPEVYYRECDKPDEWKAVAKAAPCPSLGSWKEQLMNVTGMIEELRSELQEIEDAIRSAEDGLQVGEFTSYSGSAGKRPARKIPSCRTVRTAERVFVALGGLEANGHSLERFNPLRAGAAEAGAQSVAEIRRVTEPGDGS
jgi:hypothetical protein